MYWVFVFTFIQSLLRKKRILCQLLFNLWRWLYGFLIILYFNTSMSKVCYIPFRLHATTKTSIVIIKALLLRAFKKNSLINKKVSISHARNLLSKVNRIILEVICIFSSDKLFIESLYLDVYKVFNVFCLLKLFLIGFCEAFILLY
jgi:hypothetical protein